MEKQEFLNKCRDQLQEAVWKQEFELDFLGNELGKVEDDINKTSNILYVTAKEGRKDIGQLQAGKSALKEMIRQQEGIFATLQAKLEYIDKNVDLKTHN